MKLTEGQALFLIHYWEMINEDINKGNVNPDEIFDYCCEHEAYDSTRGFTEHWFETPIQGVQFMVLKGEYVRELSDRIFVKGSEKADTLLEGGIFDIPDLRKYHSELSRTK
jgi:hypothetical protein